MMSWSPVSLEDECAVEGDWEWSPGDNGDVDPLDSWGMEMGGGTVDEAGMAL